ncbi:hypothetical protein G7043_32250 [Lentzea sp. NEAU-D13]|uniref:Uncharacterized protein n=1 Tax=Lentzea alba TaxID=2714351 RepID=A0A7C9W105_9PSEU|nr:hypothetical protein [Lentzea alba]NGY63601.1 hypothetical protein [Lentzea alba]
MRRALGALAVTLALTAAVAPPAAADLTGWAVGFLPMPEGYPAQAYISGTDHKGNYSGDILTDEGSVLVTWTDSTATVHGRPPGFTSAEVTGQNRAGTIIGLSFDLDEPRTARAWTFDTRGFTLLTVPEGYAWTYATALNDRGDVFGGASRNGDTWEAFVWPADNPAAPKAVVLPREFAERLHGFVDIDHDGSLIYNTQDGAGRWKDGRFTPLPTYVTGDLSGTTAGAVDGGQFIGSARVTDVPPVRTGCLYWPAPDVRPQPLPGCKWAFAMNRDRLVLGDEEIAGGLPRRYAVWQDGRHTGLLPSPAGHPSIDPKLVSDTGAIVGVAREEGNNSALGRPVIWRRFSG